MGMVFKNVGVVVEFPLTEPPLKKINILPTGQNTERNWALYKTKHAVLASRQALENQLHAAFMVALNRQGLLKVVG